MPSAIKYHPVVRSQDNIRCSQITMMEFLWLVCLCITARFGGGYGTNEILVIADSRKIYASYNIESRLHAVQCPCFGNWRCPSHISIGISTTSSFFGTLMSQK